MRKRTLDEARAKFWLTEEQLEEVTQMAITMLLGDKIPSENPIAIIVGGQSGAGKTSIMNFTAAELPDAVIIDNDNLRVLHPYAEQIKKEFPEYYRELTDQIGMGITSKLVDYFMGNNPQKAKYDIIFHQTLKNRRIVDDAMTKFHNAGYIVGVRALAVCYFESKMSQIERCKAQHDALGYCRHVDATSHIDTIAGIPYTISYIENSKKFDLIQIFARGKTITTPTILYSAYNPDTMKDTRKVFRIKRMKQPKPVTHFNSAKEAIVKGRMYDTIRCSATLRKRIEEIKNNGGNKIPGIKEHIDEIEYKFNEFKKSDPLADMLPEKKPDRTM